MANKTRLDGSEMSAFQMMEKIAKSGKNDYSASILGKCIMGLGEYAQPWLRMIDKLGLWNDRVYMLYQAIKPPKYTRFAEIVISMYERMNDGEFTQDDIIKCKSSEDFEKLLTRKVDN